MCVLLLTNLGLLKLPIEQIYRGRESKARNQRMQNMFRMIGYGENLGSGFPLILNAWNEKHWLKPELLEQLDLMQVKLTLHIQNEPINEDITERQKAILSSILQKPLSNRDELAEMAGVSLATIKREITILRKNGYIDKDGSNKNGQWLILKRF